MNYKSSGTVMPKRKEMPKQAFSSKLKKERTMAHRDHLIATR
jgi:hypothetical protein